MSIRIIVEETVLVIKKLFISILLMVSLFIVYPASAMHDGQQNPLAAITALCQPRVQPFPLVNLDDTEDLNTQLHEAAYSGDREQVKKLLADGAQIDSRTRAKQTVLHQAVISEDAATVALLLQCRVDPNAENCMGFTPLDYAVCSKQRHMRQFLRFTPLDYEVYLKQRYIIKLLCDAGARSCLPDYQTLPKGSPHASDVAGEPPQPAAAAKVCAGAEEKAVQKKKKNAKKKARKTAQKSKEREEQQEGQLAGRKQEGGGSAKKVQDLAEAARQERAALRETQLRLQQLEREGERERAAERTRRQAELEQLERKRAEAERVERVKQEAVEKAEQSAREKAQEEAEKALREKAEREEWGDGNRGGELKLAWRKKLKRVWEKRQNKEQSIVAGEASDGEHAAAQTGGEQAPRNGDVTASAALAAAAVAGGGEGQTGGGEATRKKRKKKKKKKKKKGGAQVNPSATAAAAAAAGGAQRNGYTNARGGGTKKSGVPGAASAAAAAAAGGGEGKYNPTYLECLVFGCECKTLSVSLTECVAEGHNPNDSNTKGLPLLHSILGYYHKMCTDKTVKPIDLFSKIMVLIQHKTIDKNGQDSNGLTMLHIVLNWGLDQLVQPLLDNGAAVDIRDHSSQTPLHFAAHESNEPMVRLLLEMGADPHAQTCDGFTPWDLAKTTEIRSLLEKATKKGGNGGGEHAALEGGAQRNGYTNARGGGTKKSGEGGGQASSGAESAAAAAAANQS